MNRFLAREEIKIFSILRQCCDKSNNHRVILLTYLEPPEIQTEKNPRPVASKLVDDSGYALGGWRLAVTNPLP